MATMIPDLSDAQLSEIPSSAEVKVYRSFKDKLPKDYVVFFEVGWILKREEDQARDGETDFVVCRPQSGFCCIEVKGGGVEFDAATGEWFSIDRYKQKHSIKNPVNQALKAKFSILNKLKEHPKWKGDAIGKIPLGHAVFFPDIGTPSALIRPDLPKILIGCKQDIEEPLKWISSVFTYWGNQSSGASSLGQHGIDAFRDVFGRSFVAPPLVSSLLDRQEERRLKLTNDQIRVLDFLRSHRRVAVSGGAGTGKTVLAVEKARRLASEGFKTLLTCYNRPLADHLSRVCEGVPNLHVMGFHQLCYRWVKAAGQGSGRDLVAEAKLTYPGKDLYDIQLPNALAYALEELPDRYDAIVCDEGQDFREEFWLPIELLLSEYDKAPLYVFYDDNQNLYSRAGTFPISDEPFILSTNCRNTAPIHEAAYKHYKGLPVCAPDIEGDDVQFEEGVNIGQQVKKIGSRIVDLVAKQGVSPGDIVVLIVDAEHKADYYAALKKLTIPKPAVWLEEGERSEHTILMDTVQRFKGLESSVVILWGLDTIDCSHNEEQLYVGLSRAKSMLFLVGRPEILKMLV